MKVNYEPYQDVESVLVLFYLSVSCSCQLLRCCLPLKAQRAKVKEKPVRIQIALRSNYTLNMLLQGFLSICSHPVVVGLPLGAAFFILADIEDSVNSCLNVFFMIWANLPNCIFISFMCHMLFLFSPKLHVSELGLVIITVFHNML